MKTRVVKMNLQRGMVALEAEDGYSIIEMLSDDPIEVGDIISWTEHLPEGETVVTNHTQNEKYEVYFQNHWVSRSDLDQQLLIE